MKLEIYNEYGGVQYSSNYRGLYLLREGTATKSSDEWTVSIPCTDEEIVAVQLQKDKPVSNIYWKNGSEHFAIRTSNLNSNSLKYRVYGNVTDTEIPLQGGFGLQLFDEQTGEKTYDSRAYIAKFDRIAPIPHDSSVYQEKVSFPFSSYVILPKKGSRWHDKHYRFVAQYVQKMSVTDILLYPGFLPAGNRRSSTVSYFPEEYMVIMA